jgi:hypothetical protein
MSDRILPVTSTGSSLGVGSELGGVGGVMASAVWVAANRAIYTPLYIPEPGTITKLWWLNGSAVSGNVCCALYRASDLSRVVTSGAVAQSGTSVMQEADVTDTVIPAGVYLLGLVLDNGTGQIARNATHVLLHRAMGITQEASACPLPATATPAALAAAFVPACGIAIRTLVA